MALENRIAKLERTACGRVGALVSVVLGGGKKPEELDLELEREDRRITQAQDAGRRVVVIRIGARVRGWRERLAARRARGLP